MASDENFDYLLDRLRRQSVMSPQHSDPMGSQSQQPLQQQQQQPQQGGQSAHGIYQPPPLHLSSLPPQQYHRNSESINSPGLHQPQPGFSFHHSQVPSSQPPQQLMSQPPTEVNNNRSTSHIFPQNVPPYATPMSPTVDGPNAGRTASLLQLLKFSQAVPTAPISEISQPPVAAPSPRPPVASPPPTSQQQSHSRALSASDLVASLLRRSTEPTPTSSLRQENSAPEVRAKTRSPSIGKPLPERQIPTNPQDFVLQFFGRPKPSQDDMPNSESAVPRNNAASDRHLSQGQSPTDSGDQKVKPAPADPRPMSVPPATPSKLPPHQPHVPSLPFSNPTPSKGLFTYVNPFEQLHATSPRNRTSRNIVPAGSGKSSLGTTEMRAENGHLPLNSTSPSTLAPSEKPSPALAAIESEAAKNASTLDQVLEEEERIRNGFGLASLSNEEAGGQGSSESSPEQPENKDRDNAANEMTPTESFEEGQDEENIPPVGHDQDDEEEDNYESASEAQGTPILVYNFPMKPFSSITISPSTAPRPKFPVSKISDIARMPRSFDQLDRNLIAASHQFIAYAISKSNDRGGIRVLRQFDGKDKVLMKDSADRTFNVTISNGDRILGTGMSGAVVWAELSDFDKSEWNNMFIFPPSEEQGQSNGVLKSRARKTCRQTHIFAIGRGKTISIIHAPTAKTYVQGKQGNEVVSKKYLAEHARTIDTGKASKDFAFSDDDSVIISIDKAGKLKLWDAQDLINFSGNNAHNSLQPVLTPQSPMVLTNPVLMFSAVAAGEPYRATSVMFLDKFRPYHKCLALRYVIVGMKQNHTLQLWDLALGRPVQEINFPQESDTDALCSVVYHPATGIIVVGNPTRNSIYFIHLSAPKYNLPPMSQAQYIRGLAVKGTHIPKPEATAILSGLREYSFASKGQLMSLDILDGDAQGDLPPLFELYVAHSKGMTTLNVFREDLGWDAKNGARNPVDAVKEGICTLTAMSPPPLPEKDKDSVGTESEKSAKSDRGTEKAENPKAPEKARLPDVTEASEVGEKSLDAPSDQGLKPSPPENAPKGPAKSRSVSPGARGADPAGERPAVSAGNTKRKRKDKANLQQSTGSSVPPEEQKSDKAVLAPTKPRSALATIPGSESEPAATLPAYLDREIKKFEKTVSTEFSTVIGREMADLYRRFDEDKRIQQAAGDAKQDAILRLLSSTLSDNVEQVIGRIVMTNIQGTVVPAIAEVATAAVEKSLGENISRSLNASLPAELNAVLPDTVRRTLAQPEFLSRIADAISRPVEREMTQTMRNSIIPAFKQLTIDNADRIATEANKKHNETILAFESLRQQDNQKIEQLMDTVKSLSDTVAAMAKSQAEFQDQVQRAQAEYVQAYEQGNDQEIRAPPRAATPPAGPTPEELEAEEIERFLRNGRYEEGTIKWLQSKERQAELFDEVVVRYRYDFLPNLSQLVLLSVSAAVSIQFENKVYERLSWLEGVLAVLDPLDPEIHAICHRIMAVVVQRLEQFYMNTAEENMGDPILRKIPPIARRARELSSMAA